MKWGIITLMNNKRYFYKSKGNINNSVIWSLNKDKAKHWDSRGGAEYYVVKNRLQHRGAVLKI